jgi:predicted ATPase
MEAESCFQQTITSARHQKARSLELRSVVSLSRLYHQQNKKEQARQILAEIYDWFTEGFDTADLREAKSLLQDVSGANHCLHSLESHTPRKRSIDALPSKPLSRPSFTRDRFPQDV